jgi:hypothetical protein
MPEYTCKVNMAGPSTAYGGKTYFNLSDIGGAFQEVWFVAPDVIHNEMLATALTAVSTSAEVLVFLASTVSGTEVTYMYVSGKP